MVRFKAEGPRSVYWPGHGHGSTVERLAPTWSPYIGPVHIAVPGRTYRRPVVRMRRAVAGTRHVPIERDDVRERIQELLRRFPRSAFTTRVPAPARRSTRRVKQLPVDLDDFSRHYRGPYADVTLAGFWDDPSAYIQQKWTKAKARAQALVGEFLKQKARLLEISERIEDAISATEGSEKTATATQRKLVGFRSRASRLLDDQVEIEAKLADAKRKIEEAEDALSTDQLGVAPLVIPVVAAAVAVVAVVAGLVIMHTQHVNQLERELNAVVAGEIDPDDLSKMKGNGKGFFADLGEGLGGPIVLGLMGLGLVWYLTKGKKR